jgi:hypothetical protein
VHRIASLAALLLLGAGQEPPVQVDFVRDVQPILRTHCWACHGPEKQKGKLRLDSKELAFKGGLSGKVIVPGDAKKSLLYERVVTDNEDERMPLDKEPLPAGKVAVLREWLEQGAPWPDGASVAGAKVEMLWSLVPPVRREPPRVRDAAWVRTPIDAFVLAALEAKGLAPAAEAPKETLLRRASLDLTGLPPSPEEVDAFLADRSPRAFEGAVDRLLASPHYGERWARHWLDLARYAESEGFKSDETRPNSWRWRDWVIRSLNDDKPYDRFVREQIAGDELWPDDPDAGLATAFHRHYPDESNARNLVQRRQEILNDITDAVGAVFFGLTFACARCHNHKYDPILQADYYRLQAFFSNIRVADDLSLAPPEARAKLAEWEERTRAIRSEMAALEAPRRKALEKEFSEKFPEEIRKILEKRPEERTADERPLYYKAMQYLGPDSHAYVAPRDLVAKSLTGEAKKKWEALKAELEKVPHPGEPARGTGIADCGREAARTYILRRGVYDALGPEVQPGFPTVLDPRPAKVTPTAVSSGRRAALANWLADPTNPITARLMANRIWAGHFGVGIARTPSDLGVQGERPTHPELLDWLAVEFVARGWSMKAMHRLIVTSSAYRQSSGSNPGAAKVDPENRLLWRFPRHRLEGEAIRDGALAVSGLLNRKMGGPSVFPELPEGMTSRGGWPVTRSEEERNRRSVYVFVRRNTRYPMLEAFDMPDTHESCARRHVSTTPVQALALLNNTLTLQWAQAFAARVLRDAGADRDAQVGRAWRLAFARRPAEDERELARRFWERHRAILARRIEAGEAIAMPAEVPSPVQPVDAAVLVDFCHALLNASEFIYRD